MFCDFFMTFLSLKNDLHDKFTFKSTKQKIISSCPLEEHWRKEQDPKPDPLVRDMGPRIRICTKCHGSTTLSLLTLIQG